MKLSLLIFIQIENEKLKTIKRDKPERDEIKNNNKSVLHKIAAKKYEKSLQKRDD